MAGKSKSRKSVLSAIESVKEEISIHEKKLANAHEIQDRYNIPGWIDEIERFKKQLVKLQQELGIATDD